MIISEIVLLGIGQIVSVVSSTLVAQVILPPDVEQENHGTDNAKPYEAET